MTRKYEPEWYRSPIDLPAAESGKVSIRHKTIPVGETVPLVGLRQALTRGIKPVAIKLTEPLRIHELGDSEHGLWMTDAPEELNQIGEMLNTVRPRGRVLVGGLGLGIVAQYCARNSMVTKLVTVERDPDVIALCGKKAYHVVQADLFDYLRAESTRRFDYYLLDTWQATSEGEWWESVLPYRRAIRNRWGRGPIIHCWAEDIMQGQVAQTLMTKPPHWYYEHLPLPMDVKTTRSFLRDVGLPMWERRWGAAVDKAYEGHGGVATHA